jgi:predicted ATPase/class 3 adenylate cyclase
MPNQSHDLVVMRRDLPSGTVTFLFTDVESSTKLLHELGAQRYADALAEHRRVVRAACAAQGGVEVDTQGDAFFVAFPTAPGAVQAARSITEGLEAGPIRLRIGLHTGTPLVTDEGYVGEDVHRAARIAAAGAGGQVLVSASTAPLTNVELRDLGEHRFRDLSAPEHVYQLGEGDFAALKSLGRSNLPVVAWPLLGRERELDDITTQIRSGVRLLTLTGVGGSGKTRLALHAAGELAEDFVDGVFFVALAPLGDVSLVPGAIADALGVPPDDDLGPHLEAKTLLIVLDNAEHLEGIDGVVVELLVGEVVVIVTSRAPLHLSAERELVVEPLAVEAAGELFAMRAAASGQVIVPGADVRALCIRLDNLPLAVELAAARTKLLSPRAILTRLDRALPFLTGGLRDAPERQRTLSATIAWSHDLLEADERLAFRRLAVFRGGFDLDAAEAVANADLDAVAALVDQSLLKAVEDRFLMLETIREFAAEQLRQAGEEEVVGLRHARFYVARLEEIEPVLRGPRTLEFLAWYDRETQNTWAALDTLLAAGENELAFRLADLLAPYWIARSRMEEGLHSLQRVIERAPERTAGRGHAIRRIGDLLGRLGRPVPAGAALEEARAIAEETGDFQGLCLAERDLAWSEHKLGRTEAAINLARTALARARELDEDRLVASAGADLANFLVYADEGRDEAQELLEASLAYHRRIGDETNVVTDLSNLATLEIGRGNWAEARRRLKEGLEIGRRLEAVAQTSHAAGLLGFVALEDGDSAAALLLYREALERALEFGAAGEILIAIEGIAFTVSSFDVRPTACLLGAAQAIRAERQLRHDPMEEAAYARHVEIIRRDLGPVAFEEEVSAGAASLSLDDAAALALDLSRAGRVISDLSTHGSRRATS